MARVKMLEKFELADIWLNCASCGRPGTVLSLIEFYNKNNKTKEKRNSS